MKKILVPCDFSKRMPCSQDTGKHESMKLVFPNSRVLQLSGYTTNQEFPYDHIQAKIPHKLQVLQPADTQIYRPVKLFVFG